MKKYLKELIIAGIEIAFIYLFPLIPMGNKDAHIILLMVITLIVGIVGVAISNKKIKFLFPIRWIILRGISPLVSFIPILIW